MNATNRHGYWYWNLKLKQARRVGLHLALLLVGGLGTACGQPDYQFVSMGLATDNSGNLYIADSYKQVIRRLAAGTTNLTTIAGAVGMTGSSDGTGAAARFSSPWHLAVDGTGDLYVADSGNSTIRKVVPATGQVTTVAGSAGLRGSADGIGTAARFLSPSGLVTDGAGNLYVTDTTGATVRKIALATGQVTTLAGTAGMSGEADGLGSTAQFLSPQGLTADGAGNLYVVDTDSSTVRKIVPATGQVTTLAGAAGREGTSDGIGAAARFRYPAKVTVDPAGNLYVSDEFSCTIRKVALSTAEVTTWSGAVPRCGEFGIGSLAADRAGNLYVADPSEPAVRKIVLATGETTTVITADMLR